MWMMVREFYQHRNWGGRAVLINQVHDACYGDAHKDVAIEAASVIHACMELATTFMEVYFDWPCPVHVPSETTYGPNMSIEEKVPNVVELAKARKAEIDARYINQYRKAA
jgi:hypothetical protein